MRWINWTGDCAVCPGGVGHLSLLPGVAGLTLGSGDPGLNLGYSFTQNFCRRSQREQPDEHPNPCLQNASIQIRKEMDLIINERGAGAAGGEQLAFCKTSAIAACDVAAVWTVFVTRVSELLGAKRVELNQEMLAFRFVFFFSEKWRLLHLWTANW